MFKKVDKMLKILGIITFFLLAIGTVVGAIVGFAEMEDIGISFLILVGGAFVTLLFSFMLYGYGELIEKAKQIEENTRNLQCCPPAPGYGAPVQPMPQGQPAVPYGAPVQPMPQGQPAAPYGAPAQPMPQAPQEPAPELPDL